MTRETVYGIHTVGEVLRRGRRGCHELLTSRSAKDAAFRSLLALARERGVPVRHVSRQEIENELPGRTHQGVALVADELPALALDAALEEIAVSDGTIWLALDGITDPHNLGAILRNAACFGATAVILTERRSAKASPLVQKIASGAAEIVPVIEEVNLNRAVRRLKREGFWVYGAALEGKPLDEVRFNGPLLLVIGAEGTGIRRKTREHADELVRIPQAADGVASLNASCASAVLLHEISRRLSG
ncbi:MAG: 23S rRNA (guanosine(2251)-2'-O)-methyltransferase RlmB [Planctomycetota bacterium]|jgi:23S rRNA (guanosine2251-2'-O)-methyltransferase